MDKETQLKAQVAWMMMTLDLLAESKFGEFGYDTLKPTEQAEVWKEILGNVKQYGVELV